MSYFQTLSLESLLLLFPLLYQTKQGAGIQTMVSGLPVSVLSVTSNSECFELARWEKNGKIYLHKQEPGVKAFIDCLQV